MDFKKKGELEFADDGVDADIQRRVVWRRGRECGYPINSGMAHISSVSLKTKQDAAKTCKGRSDVCYISC